MWGYGATWRRHKQRPVPSPRPQWIRMVISFPCGSVSAAPDVAVASETQGFDEILGNLLDNPCKGAHSRVTVSASADHGRVVVYIDDDGPGLNAAAMPGVMRPGRRRGFAWLWPWLADRRRSRGALQRKYRPLARLQRRTAGTCHAAASTSLTSATYPARMAKSPKSSPGRRS